MNLFLERSIGSSVTLVAGVDEAGRGPLAGPVYAAAVVWPDGLNYSRIDDSKQLTAKTRESLYEYITANTIHAIASAGVGEIDELNILEAALLAMRRAVAALPQRPDYLLVDGNVFRGFDIKGQCVIGGDALSVSVAAASVLAKVERDRAMLALDAQYPGYGFAQHKGYGTKAHREALRRLGPCPAHRRSFKLT
jgi:ribonuclease HII